MSIEWQLAQVESDDELEPYLGKLSDFYPTPEEITQAMYDADEMNYNMRTFGTIDRPKTHMRYVGVPKWFTRQQALEIALEHVRNYHDRCYLQFLISMEKRNDA